MKIFKLKKVKDPEITFPYGFSDFLCATVFCYTIYNIYNVFLSVISVLMVCDKQNWLSWLVVTFFSAHQNMCVLYGIRLATKYTIKLNLIAYFKPAFVYRIVELQEERQAKRIWKLVTKSNPYHLYIEERPQVFYMTKDGYRLRRFSWVNRWFLIFLSQ